MKHHKNYVLISVMLGIRTTLVRTFHFILLFYFLNKRFLDPGRLGPLWWFYCCK